MIVRLIQKARLKTIVQILITILLGFMLPFTDAQSVPVNDNFADAVFLDQSANQGYGTTIGASLEAGEMIFEPGADGRTVWYRWTAPTNGVLHVWARVMTGGNMASGIFRGQSVGELERIGGVVRSVGAMYSYSAVQAGQRVSIGVDSIGSDSGQDFVLAYNFSPACPNDDFRDALTISVGQVTAPVGSDGATMEPGEPDHGQIGTLWFKWTPQDSGTARAAILGLQPFSPPGAVVTAPASLPEGIFTPLGGIQPQIREVGRVVERSDGIGILKPELLSIYTGSSLSDLALLAHGFSIECPVESGTTYWIAVENIDQWGIAATQTSFTLALLTNRPANDDFENALTVEEASSATLAGNVYQATREPGEPDLGPDFGEGTVWFRYRAATFGNVVLGQHYIYNFPDVFLAVFRGAALSNLSLVTKSTNGILSFFAREGEEFAIAVSKNPVADAYKTFELRLFGPVYGEYLSTVDQLFPAGGFPLMLYLRGATAMLYEKSEAGWKCIEMEPIVGEQAIFSTRPVGSVDGSLRVTIVDDPMPAPTIRFERDGESVAAVLTAFPGQTCSVSVSPNLMNWSAGTSYTSDGSDLTLDPFSKDESVRFFRITQSLPTPVGSPVVIRPGPPYLGP